jgi:hypothetical protein
MGHVDGVSPAAALGATSARPTAYAKSDEQNVFGVEPVGD